MLHCGVPCFVHMGLRHDVRRQYNIEGSNNCDLYVPPSIPCFSPLSLHSPKLLLIAFAFSRIAAAHAAAFLARSRKTHVKSSSRELRITFRLHCKKPCGVLNQVSI